MDNDNVVSSAGANRHFSQIIRAVRGVMSFVVTSHGRPVARIIPFKDTSDAGSAARASFVDRLRVENPMSSEEATLRPSSATWTDFFAAPGFDLGERDQPAMQARKAF